MNERCIEDEQCEQVLNLTLPVTMLKSVVSSIDQSTLMFNSFNAIEARAENWQW